MKILKESIENKYVFELAYTDKRSFRKTINASNIIEAWEKMGNFQKHWADASPLFDEPIFLVNIELIDRPQDETSEKQQ